MFVDASAIVAILTEEDEAQALADELDAAGDPITSPIAVWEAAASISRKTGRRADAELPAILTFLDAARVDIAPVDMAVAAGAATAFDRYSRRSGHGANLNMGDCFAYAFAKQRNLVLLCKGQDFLQTDARRSKR